MYKTILVTVDGTSTDRAILEHVKPLAKLAGSRVVLLHVADGWAARTYGADAVSREISDDKAYLGRVRADMQAAGIPSGPINDIAEVFAYPPIQHREMAVETPHPLHPGLKGIRNPIRLSETPIDRYDAPPLLGQHTDEVLQHELELSASEIAELRAARVI